MLSKKTKPQPVHMNVGFGNPLVLRETGLGCCGETGLVTDYIGLVTCKACLKLNKPTKAKQLPKEKILCN